MKSKLWKNQTFTQYDPLICGHCEKSPMLPVKRCGCCGDIVEDKCLAICPFPNGKMYEGDECQTESEYNKKYPIKAYDEQSLTASQVQYYES